MRLWHIDTLNVLPKKQLQGQWRELFGMMRNFKKYGYANHILCNYIHTVSKKEFINYFNEVYLEMKRRDLNVSEKKYNEWMIDVDTFFETKNTNKLHDYHNDEQRDIEYYNLLEKYIRGAINEQEWKKYKKSYSDSKLR